MTFNPQEATALFRITQECLTNIIRHARASVADISLTGDNHQIVLMVRDDGVGIKAERAASPKSLGLIGMSERAFLLGGRFEISGAPRRGTTVRVTIPRRREAHR
jgi:signal transduction histidine kinase